MTNKKEQFDAFIFTHIPKCGGTSFRKFINEAALASGIEEDEVYIPGFNGISNDKNIPQLTERELEQLRHKKLKVIANHAKHDVHKSFQLNLSNPFYYTILRDPVKRFISHYHFFYFKLGYDNCKGIALKDLKVEKRKKILNHLSNIEVHYIANIKYVRVLGMENILKIAKYNLQHEYPAFGIVEDMETSLQKLKAKIPDWIKFASEFPMLNRSDSNAVEMPENIVSEIEEANKFDIALYNFALDLFKNN